MKKLDSKFYQKAHDVKVIVMSFEDMISVAR